MDSAVKIENLSISRGGKRVLKKINCTIPKGYTVGLFGPSGSGKTTLMRTLVGLQKFQTGSVEVLGIPSGTLSLRSKLGYMSQEKGFYLDLTVRQNLEYFGAINGAKEQQVDQILKEMKLEKESAKMVDQLSGGQQARVSLGIALLGNPELLILDEPTVGLDPLLRRDLWGYFNSLAANGMALLISSHVMDEALHCDHIILLRQGRLLAFDSTKELLGKTKSQNMEEAFVKLVEIKR